MATKNTTTRKAPARKATTKKAPSEKAPLKKSPTAKPVAKKTKAASANGEAQARKLSALDAAAKVLADTRQAMNCKELIEALAAKKLWTSPGGKTPHATLYSAILREIDTKGKEARFKKAEPGKFALRS